MHILPPAQAPLLIGANPALDDPDSRTELLQQQAFAILAFTYPRRALETLRQAVALERSQGLTTDPVAEVTRQAVLAANEAFLKACEEIFLPLIEAWPSVFNAPVADTVAEVPNFGVGSGKAPTS